MVTSRTGIVGRLLERFKFLVAAGALKALSRNINRWPLAANADVNMSARI